MGILYRMPDKGLAWYHHASNDAGDLPAGAIIAQEPAPVGEERSCQLDGATRFVRDAVRRWSDGRVDTLRSYFQRDVPEVGHEADDYCTYCGCNNGPDGRDRQGFDCCQCGGN
jgi:hypothetical protein